MSDNPLRMVQWTARLVEKLRLAHLAAVEANADNFWLDIGKDEQIKLDVRYARYLLEHLLRLDGHELTRLGKNYTR